MKKTQKAALSILLVLALLATLPLTALADDLPNNTGTETPPMNVESGDTMVTNTGTIGSNEGTITDNGVKPAEGQQANLNSGTVNENGYSGKIENNYGTVVENGSDSGAPTISNNYGLVVENFQSGTVSTNQSGGIVTENYSGGTVTDNYGNVGNNAGGTVTNNKNGGEVYNNGGTVGTNESGGVVYNESGTVTSNASAGNGEGTAGVINDGGTVGTNEVGGVVDNLKGEVHTNKGTVVYNGIAGKVTNAENGTVTHNLGTVVDTDGKTYYGLHGWYKDEDDVHTEHLLGSYEAGKEIDLDQKVAEITREGYKLTEYKIQVYQDGKLIDYAPDKEVVARANVDAGDGGGDGEGEAAKPLYRISAPTLLKLTWEKIASIFKPAASTASSVGGGGGPEAVELSAKKRYIGLGSVIFINEKGYKVVEIKDDAYVVASFDALSDEDVKDLDALFAKLFTAEQQKQIKNIGQLLDAEDVLAVFGKPGNHPVFEISKALVE